MHYRYPHVTSGYLLINQSQLTLNAAFYTEFFGTQHDMNDIIVFPQRVPKKTFFDEIAMLENNDIYRLITAQQDEFVKQMNYALGAMKQHNKMQRAFLNWLNILLRYGLANEICTLNEEYLHSHMNLNDFTEFKLIKLIAHFQLHDNTPDETSTEHLNYLIQIAVSNSDLTNRLKILILNYTIVAVYRYKFNLSYQKCIKNCCETLLGLIEHDNDFGNMIRTSVAYRGLAMINELDIALRDQYVKKAESIARNIKTNDKLELLVAKENLYTCLQTLSKWNVYLNQIDSAKANLIEMTELDPFDPTGYAELAFFLFDHECFEEAAYYFKRAVELGPPGVGMHTYYHAKCSQYLGKNCEAITLFYEATKIDHEAVSPWLDLIQAYFDNDQLDKAKDIIRLVLSNPIYKNQLEDDEANQFETVLRNGSFRRTSPLPPS